MDESRYPRMLFRGDHETSVAHSRDELLAKRADGWRARLLPGETPEDIGEVPTEEPDEVRVPPKRGRPPKSAE